MSSPITIDHSKRTTPCNPTCQHPLCKWLMKEQRMQKARALAERIKSVNLYCEPGDHFDNSVSAIYMCVDALVKLVEES
jgi:hypothetical protein